MKVIFLSRKDYANMGYELSKCLRTVGVDAEAYATGPHKFNYIEKAEVVPKDSNFTELTNSADVIVFMHSEYTPINGLKNKKSFVFHGGSLYRKDFKKVNDFFNPIISGAIVQTGDLLNRGAKNEKWLLPPIDLDKLLANYNKKSDSKIIMGHYPSCKPKEKGSYRINEAMSKILHNDKFVYKHAFAPMPWSDHIKRIGACDVYIEQLRPRKGEWGIAALEAAALGCIVITNFDSVKLYNKVYGECPIHVASTKQELTRAVYNLLEYSDDQLVEEKKKFRRWIESYHTYKKVGQRLLGIINDNS